ncbi:MAG: hypothetical protein FIB04_12365 [Gammaproteobacteria bacterium]|nr:hypothetical protein [Gammaproteobacteria bacterium]
MPLPRLFESPVAACLVRVLLPVALSCAPVASFGQSATPAVSTIVSFYASVPNGGMVLGPDGALYGTTSSASTVTGGLVYRAAVDGSSVTTLYQLSNNEAYSPKSGLLLAGDGLLYGTTSLGAVSVEANTTGTVFRIGTNGRGFTILHKFAQTTRSNQDGDAINDDGAFPESALIQGPDGYLYGMARAGGPNGTGTVYKMSTDGSSFTVLHTFGALTSSANASVQKNLDGAGPIGTLLLWTDGKLYGTTRAGGVNGRGTIFRVGTDGQGFQTLHEFPDLSSNSPFTNADGATPLAGLTDGADGRLYGVASAGGANGVGTIFVLDPASPLFTVLHDFEDKNGNGPAGALILGQDTRLYGTTSYGGTASGGGSSNLGILFSIARDGTGFTNLHSFESAEAAHPIGRLLQLNASTLVGIASDGGKCGQGTLFQYSSTGAKVTGNTSCGQKKNKSGGGAVAPSVLLLLGVLGMARLRRRW